MIFFFYVSYVLCARVFAMQSVFNLIKVKQNLNFFFYILVGNVLRLSQKYFIHQKVLLTDARSNCN